MSKTENLWQRVPNGCDQWVLIGTNLELREDKRPRSKAAHQLFIQGGPLLRYICGKTLGEAMQEAARLPQ